MFAWVDPFAAEERLDGVLLSAERKAGDLSDEAALFERERERAVARSRGLMTTDVREFGQAAASARRAAGILRSIGRDT